MTPIYVPSGRAREYGELCVNIYTGCPHRCDYCFAPGVLHVDRETFHTHVEPRKDIVEQVKRQLFREHITGKLIHLCFTCDPYPAWIDTQPTREVIEAIKNAGNHVQILTKGGLRAERDFDLLDNKDLFGITHTNSSWFTTHAREPNAAPAQERLRSLSRAKWLGIRTWVSCEPVYEPDAVYNLIRTADFIDDFRIGKMNYKKLDIDWALFGAQCIVLCEEYKRAYYIKEDLRKELEAAG